MDEKNRKEYVDDIRKEYEELRKEYIASQRDKSFVTLAKARSKKPRVDWRAVQIKKPSFLGTRVFADFNLSLVLPYIDWDPFFSTWQIRGKYPNRTYPKIFNDKTVGEEAKKLFANA
jgi:5-methyltetrahydrofolate--homocysteine methyltransferase